MVNRRLFINLLKFTSLIALLSLGLISGPNISKVKADPSGGGGTISCPPNNIRCVTVDLQGIYPEFIFGKGGVFDCGDNVAAQFKWLSKVGDMKSTNITVSEDAASVDVQVNVAVAMCRDKTYGYAGRTATNFGMISSSPNVFLFYPTTTYLDWGTLEGQIVSKSYVVKVYPSSYGLSKFQGGSTYNLSVTNKAINDRSKFSGYWSDYECVGGGGTPTSISNFGPCTESRTDNFTIYVDSTPTGTFDGANCNIASGWAFDPDWPSGSISIHLYVDGPAGTGTFVGDYGAGSSVLRQDVNNVYGITGNHGFSFSIPENLKDRNTHTLYIYALGTNEGGAFNWISVPLIGTKTISCPPADDASCTSYTVTSPIYPGDTFTATIVMKNTGYNTWVNPSWRLGSSVYAGTNNYLTSGNTNEERINLPNNVAPDGTVTFSISKTAPTNTGTFNYEWRMVREGVAWFGAKCGTSFTVVSPPPVVNCSITNPTIEVGSSDKLPSIALSRNQSSYSPTISPSVSATLNGSAISLQYLTNPASTTITVPNLTYNSSNFLVSFPGSIANPEGNYSLVVTISWSAGASWPAGSTKCESSLGSGSSTVSVVRKPYFKISGGDISVGGVYPSGSPAACSGSASGANVAGWVDSSVAKGANADFVAQVFGKVNEFYSGNSFSQRGSSKNFLTITNNDQTNYPWGGNSTVNTCFKDVYSTTKKDTSASSSITSSTVQNIDSLAGASEQVVFSNNLTITGTGLTDFSGKLAVYVTGNVYISGDIKAQTSYANLSSIPFFALIVKGNIYVAPGVTQLDGMYVAQPNDSGSGGAIFTCGTSSFAAVPTASLYSTCSNALTFNGIVQAKSLKLLRTFGTMSGTATNNVAETFNSLSELYLTTSPFKDTASQSSPLDSATNLPPLL